MINLVLGDESLSLDIEREPVGSEEVRGIL
jgi:hypothetical protein